MKAVDWLVDLGLFLMVALLLTIGAGISLLLDEPLDE